MKEEITNIIRTFEAVGPILGNALKSGPCDYAAISASANSPVAV